MNTGTDALSVSKQIARRFILGRQGRWPGRRWAGEAGLADALRACEATQMDPVNIVARSRDIVLWGRVQGYQPAHLGHVMYARREFFDYGGGLFIYLMRELPYWRTPMRRRARAAGPTSPPPIPPARRGARRATRAWPAWQSRLQGRRARQELSRRQRELTRALLPLADRRNDDSPLAGLRARV
jgi:hypothetical protein